MFEVTYDRAKKAITIVDIENDRFYLAYAVTMTDGEWYKCFNDSEEFGYVQARDEAKNTKHVWYLLYHMYRYDKRL